MINHDLCPCKSGKQYCACCQKYHEGISPENALVLMRSRYSAYAKGLVDYIIKTTHPQNPSFSKEKEGWAKKILTFCQSHAFVGLDILDFTDGNEVAYVTFKAHLAQGGRDVSFTERSRFLKVNGKWLYVDGVVAS